MNNMITVEELQKHVNELGYIQGYFIVTYGIFKPRVQRYRPISKLKTWKKDTKRFRVGLKHGLYTFYELTEKNTTDFIFIPYNEI